MHFPKIELASAAGGKGDALVLGWFQDDAPAPKAPEGEKAPPAVRFVGKRSKDVDTLHALLKQSRHFRAKKNEADLLRFYAAGECPNTLLLGLGPLKKFEADVARQAGASLALAQKRARLEKVFVDAESVFAKVSDKEHARFVQAFCEGYWMAGHEYTELRKADPDAFHAQGMVLVGLKGKTEEKAVDRARVVASSVALARLLGDRPANFLTPTIFAKEAERVAKEGDFKCTVLTKKEIEKEKMGLLLGVSRGSHEEPRFLVLEYQGGKKADRPVALVGKGVTFDSGGISLKPAAQMEDMKYDMMGAATVLAVCRAAAALGLPVNLMGFIALTENLPGGSAQKPGDVARSLSGKTVEIINTDAEGRLILADALEYAQKFNPQAIMDFATLTGAVVVALGTVCSGIMGTNRELIERFRRAGESSGERVWELPLYEEYAEDLKSSAADIKNSGVRDAGSSKGGIFLKYFVDAKFPWLHCDIAGAAYHRKDVNYYPAKYASGAMVRLVIDLLSEWRPLKG